MGLTKTWGQNQTKNTENHLLGYWVRIPLDLKDTMMQYLMTNMMSNI